MKSCPVARLNNCPVARLNSCPVARLNSFPVARLNSGPVVKVNRYPVARVNSCPVVKVNSCPVVKVNSCPLARVNSCPLAFSLFTFYKCIVPMGFPPWEIPVAFPGESQLRQSRATQPRVPAGRFSVSIIQPTLTWTTGSST